MAFEKKPTSMFLTALQNHSTSNLATLLGGSSTDLVGLQMGRKDMSKIQSD